MMWFVKDVWRTVQLLQLYTGNSMCLASEIRFEDSPPTVTWLCPLNVHPIYLSAK